MAQYGWKRTKSITEELAVAEEKSKNKKILEAIVDNYFTGDIKLARKKLSELEDDTKKDKVISFWKNHLEP